MENVILVTVDHPSRAYEAMEAVRRLSDDGTVALRGAAIIERYPDGRWHVPEETEEASYAGTITAGGVGALLGALVGPAGVLLGATAGLVVGSLAESDDVTQVETILHSLPRHVPPGATALVIDVEETDPDVLDAVLTDTATRVERMSRAEVEAELAALERAAADQQAGDHHPDER